VKAGAVVLFTVSVAAVLVADARAELIRRRETLDDLLQFEPK